MKRLLFGIVLAALFATTLGASPASADLSACIGYSTVASISDKTGTHRLSTQGNVCLNFAGYDGGKALWTAVARYKCYRDGVLFGDGVTGGCRWQGHLKVYAGYTSASNLMTDRFWAVPGSTSSTFISDSGRIYGYYAAVNLDWIVKGCSLDAIVHFVGATGIDYGTFNMADKCSYTVPA
jgi:hypothetical protein